MTLEDKAFIEDLIEVCKRHNRSLSHEDGQGAFLVEDYDPFYDEWLRAAYRFEVAKEERPL